MHAVRCQLLVSWTALLLVVVPLRAQSTSGVTRDQVLSAMRQAATYYRTHVASHGGYVYHYSLDLEQRWGEGAATVDQIWVQPPGTPTVGLALLKAYEATGDRLYLEAAADAARALVYGQLVSGGWTNCVDFDPQGSLVGRYRGTGKGASKKKRNISSLDDGQTQSALQLLIHVDRALNFADAEIHTAATTGLEALLAAQFPSGAFPQVWTGPVPAQAPAGAATYPEYDWRTEGRIREYWDMYTLNDNVPGYVTHLLIDAAEIYQDPKYLEALRRLGDFLILAQMPQPQPGWAQQYNYAMQPIWARKFEPPAVASDETQETIATLLLIYRATGDEKYLQPIPAALQWLRRSQLGDGQLARYYELRSNRPLYMQRSGEVYSLTYDDSNLPDHYGWKIAARIDSLERHYRDARGGADHSEPPIEDRPSTADAQRVQAIVAALDEQGRWVSTYDGERLVGQPKMPLGAPYLSSEVFSRHLTMLSAWLVASKSGS